MGSIIERRRKDGSTAYMAQIMLMREGKIAHRENQTFDRKPAAAAWIKKREAELARPGAVLGQSQKVRCATLAEAIDRYISESLKAMGRTKAQVLRSIKTYDIADMPCCEIKSHHILVLAKELGQGREPQTVGNYLSHLGAVFAIARPAWGYELDQSAMLDASKVAKRLGATSKSKERDRRPTIDELDAVMTYFAERSSRSPKSAPLHIIVAFALFSTRRQDEITRIAWEDLDAEHSRILVRDMKHPGQKIGNDVWCDLPEPALRIINGMKRGKGRIFPYNPQSISTAFRLTCNVLSIEDLHFHDLRHAGVSRLFEMGLSIPHVAAVSGHRSWTSLKRYTHLRAKGDSLAGWVWLERIAGK